MKLALSVSALSAQLPSWVARAEQLGLSPSDAWNVLVVAQLRAVLQGMSRARGREFDHLASGRLFQGVPGFEADALALRREQLLSVESPRLTTPNGSERLPIEAFGQIYESLLAARPDGGERNLRKRTGSYYTPEALTSVVAQRGFEALSALLGEPGARGRRLRILDPALGAGAFLVRAGREIAERSGRSLAEIAERELFGVDVSPLAVAVAEASLWLLADSPELTLAAAGVNLTEGDALCSLVEGKVLARRGVDFDALLPDGAESFDMVLGNPPWVAFAGRATQPVAPALRAHYRRKFQAFRGYPTLHALFVELAARLAPRGIVALLIPSPVADLDGYRPMRLALAASHAAQEPLLELGQDAFEGVTQPCFALVASPRTQPELDPGRAFVLSERRRSGAVAVEIRPPLALLRLAGLPRLPSALFGEMGLQTNGAVTRELLYRGTSPPADFDYALLEGRSVTEFALSAPRAFLKQDRQRLSALRCRLRERSEYESVKLVVRQTAAITIAARHDGTPFRNSLLAGFELPEFPSLLTLGLLNSTLYRALHLAGRRDARQNAFPQVKVSHLRALPAPPLAAGRADVIRLAQRASDLGLTPELRRALDDAVYDLFGIAPAERVQLAGFVGELSPRAGLKVPLSSEEQTAQGSTTLLTT